MRCIALLLFWCITFLPGRSQELSYRQFTVKDGLPGSIVYHCLQDRKGFIWFATNQGVSRFDGRTFHNYTKEDGLPENEILKLYLDRYDNIWFISFTGIPSVMHNDSIIRFDNCRDVIAVCEDQLTDSLLLISFNGPIYRAGYYRSPNLPGHWMFTPFFLPIHLALDLGVLRATTPLKTNYYFFSGLDGKAGILVRDSSASSTLRLHFRRNMPYDEEPFGRLLNYSPLPDGQSIVFLSYDSAYYVGPTHLSPLFSLHALHLNRNTMNDINGIFCENDSTLWLCARSQGLLRIHNFITGSQSVERFFPESDCTSIMKDAEGGYWVTTITDGVYYLPNLCFGSLSLPAGLDIASVRSLHRLDDHQLAAGFNNGSIITFDRNTLRCRTFPHWAAHNKNNRIMDICPDVNHSILVVTDIGLRRLYPDDTDTTLHAGAYKGIFVLSNHSIIASFAVGVDSLDPSGAKRRAITGDRSTCIAGQGNDFYWGTLHGVHGFLNGHTIHPGNTCSWLSGVIDHIDIAPDSSLWVSTGDGIIIWRKGEAHRIGKEQDLASNICKQVSFDGNTAWAATDKGISRIDYEWKDTGIAAHICNITEEDGLRANDVNHTVVIGGRVWAATSRGICFFPTTYNGRTTTPPGIVVTRISADDKPIDVTGNPTVNYRSGKLLLELAGISYRSGRHVGYEYRLQGADSNWTYLTGNILEFPTLPYGQFTLQLRSIDRWGGKSIPIAIPVIHPRPFYRSGWFLLSAYAVMFLLTAGGFYLYSRRRQRKRDAEFRLRRKMHDLELSALRAQMNPHFIFNCLTSIQSHILRADTFNANNYLHKFSNLIRMTLQHSSSSAISIYDELKMLTLYLELEKLRLGNRMNYRIIPPQEPECETLFIPSMIIQPYVENAIQHGIAPLKDRTGELSVEFHLSPGYLHCTIEDNGQGIEYSRTRQQAAGHISLGTGITAKRIETINAIYKQQIKLEIIDKTAAGRPDHGTLVLLSFPLSIN